MDGRWEGDLLFFLFFFLISKPTSQPHSRPLGLDLTRTRAGGLHSVTLEHGHMYT